MAKTISEAIASCSLFEHVDVATLRTLIDASELVSGPRGRVLIAEGSRAENLYIIVSGRVRVWTSAARRDVDLEELGPGSYFGEVSLLSGKQATATVDICSDSATLVAMDRAAVLDLVSTDPTVRSLLEDVTLARAKDTIGKVLK